MTEINIVFVHGWGLNSAIWSSFIGLVQQQLPCATIHNLDLPGYGRLSELESSNNLTELANSCLDRAPERAVWVGWSLGGMVALKAAMVSSQRIEGLQLIGTTPCFVKTEGWAHGVDVDIFQKFSDELAADYQCALSTFLLLQSGASRGARSLAREAHNAICQWPDPSPRTLQLGIDALARSDLRLELEAVNGAPDLPTQVVVGVRDRVANPAGSAVLADLMSAELVQLNAGHAPFLTEPKIVLEKLMDLLRRAYPEMQLGAAKSVGDGC